MGAHIAGRFRLESKHGSGGMGTVYRAVDEERDCNVAVKVLDKTTASDVARFEREAVALSRLSHPAIVGYVAHGEDGGARYLVMEWADGRTLRAHLQQVGVDPAETVVLGRRLAEGLGAAHSADILHRDIKPDNVVLVDGALSRATLVDFGIAKATNEEGALTRTGVMVGTPAFMSPEQARAQRNLDARSDVFGLGCLLYQCLTGFAPFGGGYWVSVRLKVLLSDPPPIERLCPQVPREFCSLLERMLAKDPEQRPSDGDAVERELAKLPEMPSAERRIVDPEVSISQHSIAKPSASGGETAYLVLAIADDDDAEEADTFEQDTWSRRMSALERAVAPYGADLDVLVDGSAVATLPGGDAHAHNAASCALALRSELPDFPIRIARVGASQVSATPDVSKDIDRTVNLLVKGAVSAVFADAAAASPIHVDPVVAALLEDRFQVTRRGTDFVLLGTLAGSDE